MSANYDIPGAPGFSIPGGDSMSPEERDAYLLRLRFGPSLFKSGQNFSSAGGEDMNTPPPDQSPQPGVMNPAVMRGFLQSANTQAAPQQSHSEQVMQMLNGVRDTGESPSVDGLATSHKPNVWAGATPAEAQPQNEKEWNMLHPWINSIGPSQTDQQSYEQFSNSLKSQRGYEKQQGEQKVAEQNSDNGDQRSKGYVAGKKIQAVAFAAAKGIALSFDDEGNPTYQPLNPATLQAAQTMKPGGRGGTGSLDPMMEKAFEGVAPGQTPPAQSSPATPGGADTGGGMPPPPGQRGFPGRQVSPGEKTLRTGDYTLNRDGSRNIWDGRQWNYPQK